MTEPQDASGDDRTTELARDRLVNAIAYAICEADEDDDCDAGSTDVLACRIADHLIGPLAATGTDKVLLDLRTGEVEGVPTEPLHSIPEIVAEIKRRDLTNLDSIVTTAVNLGSYWKPVARPVSLSWEREGR